MMKRRPKNKRLERKHVLKVKMRTSRRRQIRWRKTGWTLFITALLGFAAYVTWRGGEAFLRWAIFENPFFEIHQLAIETDGVIQKEQIRQWAGVQLGKNLFALDLGRVRRDLEFIPTIASAEIERILPDTLRIRVTERDAVARFIFPNLNGATGGERGVYTLDANGIFMLPLEPDQCRSPRDALIDNLPFLVGIPLQDLRPGEPVKFPAALAALGLISAFEKSPLVGLVEIQSIDLITPGLLQVATRQSGQITFGLTQFDRQLRRWQAVYEYGRKQGKSVATLDLSVANNVPLVWQEPASDAAFNPLPSPQPKPLKSTRTRKKNV
jgi:POTRA domain, FtsQ-type